jgi:hypothetical protein
MAQFDDGLANVGAEIILFLDLNFDVPSEAQDARWRKIQDRARTTRASALESQFSQLQEQYPHIAGGLYSGMVALSNKRLDPLVITVHTSFGAAGDIVGPLGVFGQAIRGDAVRFCVLDAGCTPRREDNAKRMLETALGKYRALKLANYRCGE